MEFGMKACIGVLEGIVDIVGRRVVLGVVVFITGGVVSMDVVVVIIIIVVVVVIVVVVLQTKMLNSSLLLLLTVLDNLMHLLADTYKRLDMWMCLDNSQAFVPVEAHKRKEMTNPAGAQIQQAENVMRGRKAELIPGSRINTV